MVSWQGTDGPGRGIGSVPSVALAPARSGTGIESVMMDSVFGEPPHIQREVAGKERCPETGVQRPKRRATEMGGGQRQKQKDHRYRWRDRDQREKREQNRDPRREGGRNSEMEGEQRPKHRWGQKPKREATDAETRTLRERWRDWENEERRDL